MADVSPEEPGGARHRPSTPGRTEGPLAGRLLVANPRLVDRNFDRTVVLVLVHGDEGALGVILNRPTDTDLAVALPRWSERASAPGVVHVGGPVGRDQVICLVRVADPADLEARVGDDAWRPLVGAGTPDVGTLDLDVDPVLAADAIGALRVFAGYSGWSPGQLEGEVAAGGWWVLDALPGDAFGGTPDRLWVDVLRRQPGSLALVAGYPPDPRSQ